MNKLLFFLITIFLYLALYTAAADAQTMSNSQYIIQMGNFNMSAGRPSGSGYALLNTLGQTGPGLFSGSGYKVKSGFEYILSYIPFRFSMNIIFIDFGQIIPGTPVLRSNTLTVSNGSAGGYTVTVSQNRNLTSDSYGTQIPATTCDSGSCDPNTAALWNSPLTYGFGYRCDNLSGTPCTDTNFLTTNYYKPFIASPSAVAVMSGTTPGAKVGRNFKVQITYKVNVSALQRAGLYTNLINYIAAPTF